MVIGIAFVIYVYFFLVETFYSIKRSNVLIEQRFLNFITDVLEPVHWF